MITDKPKCLHDGRRTTYRTPYQTRSESPTYCDQCGDLLFITTHDYTKPPDQRITHNVLDETYRLLYTRSGRMELLKELLVKFGWDLPEHWEDVEP